MNSQAEVRLKKRGWAEVRPGHPWIYKSQIREAVGAREAGQIVRVRDADGRFLGVGYYNAASEICVRLLAKNHAVIDAAFMRDKIEKALLYRRRFIKETNAFRVVSSEADGLPGLVVDQYGEILVVQFLTAGMERLRPLVLEALKAAVPSRGIFERSDSPSRKLERLEPRCGWIEKDCGDEEIECYERNVRFGVRFQAGHKTGLYLDQRENRLYLADLGLKGRVLDAFCYEGAFGLHLAAHGARVLGIDSQNDAVRQAEANRKRNGFSDEAAEFRCANAFDELKRLEKAGERFELVILDPPSFVRNRAAIDAALSGYKEILLRSMKLLQDRGLLAVFSCSYHLDESRLMQSCMAAAWDTHRELRLIRLLKQAADHPINPFVPETYYLKGFLFCVGSI